MAWSCVEDRIADGQFGRVLRKIVFDDIYADRTALLSRHPIPLHSLAQLKVTISSDLIGWWQLLRSERFLEVQRAIIERLRSTKDL